MNRLTLPDGSELRHDSGKRYHVVLKNGEGTFRLTGTDERERGLAAHRRIRAGLFLFPCELWLIDADTGAVIRDLNSPVVA